MLAKMILALTSPHGRRHHLDRDRPRPAHPGPARDRVHPADRDLPGRGPAEDRRLLGDRGRHDDPGAAPGRPGRRRGVHPGHRRPHLRHRGPSPRLLGRDHPDGAGRQEPGPRRRPQTPTPHRSHAHRHGCPRRRLHRRALRNTAGPVPRPPRQTVVRRREARTWRLAACCAPTTTAASTTPATRPRACPLGRSASTGESEEPDAASGTTGSISDALSPRYGRTPGSAVARAGSGRAALDPSYGQTMRGMWNVATR